MFVTLIYYKKFSINDLKISTINAFLYHFLGSVAGGYSHPIKNEIPNMYLNI